MKETVFPDKRSNALFILLKTLWDNLHEKKPVFFGYLSLFFLNGLVRLAEPLLIGLIFNTIQNQITTEHQLYRLLGLMSLLLVIELLSWSFHGTGRILEQKTGYTVGVNYQTKKIQKTFDLPVAWHKDNHSGDTIDKIEKGTTAIDSFTQEMTFQMMNVFINLVGSAVVLFFFDDKAAIIALLFSFFILFLITRFDKRLAPMYKERNKIENNASAAMYDYIGNILTIITLRLKKTVNKELYKKNMASYGISKRIIVLNETKWAFAGISIQIMTVALLCYRAYSDFYSSGIIMVGTIYILYGYLEKMGHTFYSLAWMYGDVVRKGSRVENSKPIDDAHDAIKETIADSLPSSWKKIDLQGLDFTYHKDGSKRHLEQINFSFKKGEKIALIGESGSGKSTLLALLRGLYEPKKVTVICDGKTLDKGMRQVSESVTLIPQDPEIFNNTIKFNVAMGLPYKKEEITKAIQLAQFEQVLKRLKKGFKTNVLERGVSLSGGEKQRLALARGLLAAKDSDIVLLDEPTSSVDSLNELRIHENIFTEFKGKTIISSIHRLHLLEKFDTIYFFEQGKLLAHGTLNEVKNHPKFRLILRKYKNVKDK